MPAAALGMVLLLVAAGCERIGFAEHSSEEPAAPADTAAPGAAASAPPTSAARPREIYHELTRFAWYKQGQPLLHDRAAYQPAGAPGELQSDQLRLAGSYEGVDYYLPRDGSGADVVFVPIHERYWLRFVRIAADSTPSG